MTQITTQNNTSNTPNQEFGGLGISKEILAVLTRLNFITPTPIQHKAIPIAIEGKDVVGIAQTGTGKSLAFGIPLLQLLMESKNGMGLILLPTRELAIQINETLLKIGREFGLKTAVLIGGASMYQQVNQLRHNPHIIIGTPGRINDHLKQKTLSFHNVSILVLDEADCMFDMGFAPQIKQILQVVPKERQTMLFSATMPDSIIKVATTHMKLPVRVEIAPPGTAAKKVEHEIFFVKREQKTNLLLKLLSEYKGSVLVFSRTKHAVKKICNNIVNDGFKSGKYRVLVATDIASRGIDVKGIELVLNYDIPESAGDYVHRIGRTGRAGMTGKAISLVMPEQKNKVREIERLIRSTIPISQMAGFTESPLSSSKPTYAAQAPRRHFNKNNRFQKSGNSYPSRDYRRFSK
ncbi:MAG: Helicase family protein,DEAD/DEAH box helicase [Parcubacteria group bacterium GW2011_GWA1_33_6]|nr:MAG: Helicase family protein,DEAD/DEAH box helicase [Parcubacteria group bacterium GW2011_GWA1_33_6]